ncbi:SIP domain-containing protein [Kocuria rhizophila]|nr:SIP domain-containing protein [Kocuria rhizophila]
MMVLHQRPGRALRGRAVAMKAGQGGRPRRGGGGHDRRGGRSRVRHGRPRAAPSRDRCPRWRPPSAGRSRSGRHDTNEVELRMQLARGRHGDPARGAGHTSCGCTWRGAARTMPWGEQGPGPRADSYVKPPTPPAGGAVDATPPTWPAGAASSWPLREEAGWTAHLHRADATTVELAGQRVPELRSTWSCTGTPSTAWVRVPRGGLGPRRDSARLLVPSGDSAWWAAWDDGRAAGQDVVIAGDETALPAISAIVDGVEQRVRGQPPGGRGVPAPRSITVAVEVPEEADAVPVRSAGTGPGGVVRRARRHRVVLDGGTELVWAWPPRGARERNLALELWLWERLAEHARRYWVVGHTELASWQDESEFGVGHGAPRGPRRHVLVPRGGVLGREVHAPDVRQRRGAQADISFMGYWKQAPRPSQACPGSVTPRDGRGTVHGPARSMAVSVRRRSGVPRP